MCQQLILEAGFRARLERNRTSARQFFVPVQLLDDVPAAVFSHLTAAVEYPLPQNYAFGSSRGLADDARILVHHLLHHRLDAAAQRGLPLLRAQHGAVVADGQFAPGTAHGVKELGAKALDSLEVVPTQSEQGQVALEDVAVDDPCSHQVLRIDSPFKQINRCHCLHPLGAR